MSTDAVIYDHAMADDSRTVLPSQILHSLTKRWFLLLVCGGVGAVLGLFVASQMTRTYTAAGDIVIDAKSFAIPELQGAISGQGTPDPLPEVRSAALELRSDALLESVVRELHLTNYSYFNADLREPSIISIVVEKVEGMLPFLFPPPPPGPKRETALAAMELAKRLTIFYDNRSLSVSASVVLPDPELAATIVNTILKRYIDVQGDSRVKYNAAANADIMQHLNDVRSQVDALDAQARDLRAQNALVTISPSGSLGQQRLSELGTAESKASSDLQQLQAKLTLATQLTKGGNAAELADVLQSPTISRLREQEVTAAQRVAKLDTTVMPGSRLRQGAAAEYQQVQGEITREANRIVKSLSEQVAAAKDRLKSATQTLDQASDAAGKGSLIQAHIAQVEKEAESRRHVYQALMERASQTAVSPEVARQSPGVYIGSPAVVPVFPSGPHTKIVAALGMLAGMMIGSVFAVKRGGDMPFSATPNEIASFVHLPLLAVIPVSRRHRLQRMNDGVRLLSDEQDQALVLLYARLRHQAADQGSELRSVLFVASDGEDTSLLAQNFADIAGHEGERVLLIDAQADIKSSSSQGLNAVLDGEQGWRDALVQEGSSQTNLLPLERGSMDGLDRKAATRLRSMLREASDDYTLIVMASGWDARSVQASHLVQACDFTVLIIDSHKARPSAVKAAVDHLTSMKSSLGLVMLTR